VDGHALLQPAGEDAVARVFTCRVAGSDEVALFKRLKPAFCADGSAKARVLDAHRRLKEISGARVPEGPPLARVLGVGEAKSGPYVVVEKLGGVDLEARLAWERVPIAEALLYTRDAARGLAAGAGVGVVHGDVTPRNIVVLDGGGAVLGGFALGAPVEGAAPIHGTPAVLAPEIARGGEPDERSDIYALGATLFWIATGRPLFEGTPAEVIAAQQKRPVPSIATLVPDAGVAVVDLLYRLLQKDPARRPASAAEAVKLLDAALRRAVISPVAGPARPEHAFLAPPASPGASSPPASSSAGPSTPPRTASGLGGNPFAAAYAPSAADRAAESNYLAQPTGVLGSLKQMGVPEILQTLEIGKKSARVDVQVGDDQGVLFVHDGQIVRAELLAVAGTLQGEPAVVRMCMQKEGYFRIHYEKEAAVRNVERPTQFVLLEAMRQIDEASQRGARLPDVGTVDGGLEGPTLGTSGAKIDTLEDPEVTDPTSHTLDRTLDRTDEGSADSASESAGALDRTLALPLPPVSSLEGATEADADVTDPSLPLDRTQAVPVDAARAPSGRWAARLFSRGADWTALWPSIETALREGAFAALPTKRAARRAGVAAIIVVAGVVVGAALWAATRGAPGYDVAVGRILRGEAADVARALEAVPPSERTARQALALAHAYAALRDDDAALALYAATLPAGTTDARALGWLLARLEQPAPDREIDLLVLWPDDDVDALLVDLTTSVDPTVRENAVAALVERGRVTALDVEAVARLDLAHRSCGARRRALLVLGVAGRSPESLEAVERAGRRPENAPCFPAADLAATYQAVKRRL
jgi:serine/threonine protein kinase